ncbi:MAG TPA: DUF1329 domain-containing protein [Nevskiaceae bacterium]|nr:DUF1329 domain-containing protein [Nevskiaceae bacterium]
MYHFKTFATLTIAAAAAAAAALGTAYAAAPSGQKLTVFGAIAAGNAAGTIPAYTGGLAAHPKAADETPYPFATEKPRLVITAKNYKQYADKLDAATKILFERYPNYRMEVYPTRRTASYPESVLKRTAENATTCKYTDNKLGLTKGCRGGLPFPHPATGREVMWDHVLAYPGEARNLDSFSIFRAAGQPTVIASHAPVQYQMTYYQKNPAHPEWFQAQIGDVVGPASIQGLRQLQVYFLDPKDNGGRMKKTWVYTPGLRRTRVAPNASHDTPLQGAGGTINYGEQNLFSGMMDRFDYKLVGRVEMFVPYNEYKSLYGCGDKVGYFNSSIAKVMQTNFLDPNCRRWELHRLYKVVGTLKPGMHDTYSKKVYYFDEDNFLAGLYEAYDHSGNLIRAGFQGTLAYAHCQCSIAAFETFYNLNKRTYSLSAFAPAEYNKAYNEKNVRSTPNPSSLFDPRAVSGGGVF